MSVEIKRVDKHHCLDLVGIFIELEQYYFGDKAASEQDLANYLSHQVFSEHSGVKVIAAFEHDKILGFATYTIMFPAPKLSGQMYMKDLFVSSSARGKGIGLQLMKHLAAIAITHNCQRLDWTAESTNPTAGKFYKSIGASLIREKEYYRFEGNDLNKLAKSL
ncbi:acetyltransferase [Vibrio cholerae 2740-80]|uniref:N-acetyltransferase n=4 Tax=Vibrio TaxID=662 RepID=A0AAU8W8S1_9VIBR|nr:MULTISPECIES: GNAT family N-acetyltransferase [Vibrio]HAS2379923.1 GNAT family N-acetyltransferase [Vibrio cholerae O1]ANR89084.1 acetyltransferase [Vibrio cholerae 2740-80]APF62032.1 acetyltransferase [Vibrio cholerae]ASK53388.1 N-acetyltransferase [Vibrio tarriae]ASK53426.1 N-acetyltransferase [Vibrio tarriae]